MDKWEREEHNAWLKRKYQTGGVIPHSSIKRVMPLTFTGPKFYTEEKKHKRKK